MKDFVISFVPGEEHGIVTPQNFAARVWLYEELRERTVTRFNNSAMVGGGDLLALIEVMDVGGLTASWKESGIYRDQHFRTVSKQRARVCG